MIFTLLQVLKPVILVPGTCGTVLHGNVTQKSQFWYCRRVQKYPVFLGITYLIPPFTNCMLESLKLEMTEDLSEYQEPAGKSIYTKQLGDLSAFRFGEVIKGFPIFTYFKRIITRFEENGYVADQNLFGAPYDWRFGINQPEIFWKDFAKLVEFAYYKNNGTKVCLIGHSLGGFEIHQFLTKHSASEWRQQFIDSALLLAPSFGGAGITFPLLVTGKLPYIGFLFSNRLKGIMRTLGALHSQLPNHHVYGDETLSFDQEGKPIRAREYPDFLLKNGFIESNFYDFVKNSPGSELAAPDVPIGLYYNSKLKTIKGYDLKNKKFVYGDGDSIVNKEGWEYACENWPRQNRTNLVCKDLRKKSALYNHMTITMLRSCTQHIYHYVQNRTF